LTGIHPTFMSETAR